MYNTNVDGVTDSQFSLASIYDLGIFLRGYQIITESALPPTLEAFSFLPSLNEVKSVTCQTHVRHRASIVQNVLDSQKTRIFDIIDIINSHTAVADLRAFLLDQHFYICKPYTYMYVYTI